MCDDGGEGAFEARTRDAVGNAAAGAAASKEECPGPLLSTWHRRNSIRMAYIIMAHIVMV